MDFRNNVTILIETLDVKCHIESPPHISGLAKYLLAAQNKFRHLSTAAAKNPSGNTACHTSLLISHVQGLHLYSLGNTTEW